MIIRLSTSFKFLLTLIFSAYPLFLFSQETSSCAENLKTAQSLFDKGQIDQVPSMLGDCMKSGFKREEQIAAYKLLIQSYLFEENLEKADSTMLAFLKKYPEYQLSQTDHSSFINLFNTFKVKPVLQLSLHLGTNIPFITFIDPISAAGLEGESTYGSKALNLYASLEGRFEISRKIEVNIEAGFSQLNFKNVEDFMGFAKVNYNESQSRIEIPVSVCYNIKSFGKLTPYARLGLGTAFTLATAKAEFNPTDINNLISHTGPDINKAEWRIGMDLFTQIGAGAKYKTRGGYFFTELRSNFGLIGQTIKGSPPDEEPGWFYFYIDDGFHLNALNFNIGYTLIFYKPSKRKG